MTVLPLPKSTLHTRLCLIAFLGIVVFAMILLWVSQGPLTVDIVILDFVAAHRQLAVSDAIEWFSSLGAFRVLAPITLLLFLLLLWRDKRLAGFFLTTMIGIALINELIKHWVQRPRPGEPWAMLEWKSYAFPSGHSMASACFALTVCIAWHKLYGSARAPKISFIVRFLFGFFVCAIGFTRVYLGAHYPSDVVAGWSVALAWVALLYLLFYEMASKLEKSGCGTR